MVGLHLQRVPPVDKVSELLLVFSFFPKLTSASFSPVIERLLSDLCVTIGFLFSLPFLFETSVSYWVECEAEH